MTRAPGGRARIRGAGTVVALALLAPALASAAPANSAAAETRPGVAVFGFAPKLTAPADLRSWDRANVVTMQDVFVTEIVARGAFRLIPPAKVKALGVSVGGYGGGVEDDRRLAAATRKLGADYGFAGTVTRFRIAGSGARRTVTASVTGHVISASAGKRVWARRVSRRESLAAKPAATLRTRAARAVIPDLMTSLALRVEDARR
jgi:hypothetical protein